MRQRVSKPAGWFFSLLLLSVMPGGGASAQDPAASGAAEPGVPTRPRIGLVLSGGGARGAAHIGVLQVLESLHVPVDCVTGTSMGAVVGGLYASGYTPDELARLLAELDWDSLFADKPKRRDLSFRRKQDDRNFLSRFHVGFKNWHFQVPTGLIQGQKLEEVLGVLTLPVATVRDFDQLAVPFRAVATDIETGKAVVIDHGVLATALRASMSIPGAFSPVELDGRLLVDGGTAMNLPVQVAQEVCADRIIAVDISTPLRTSENLVSAFAISGQVITIGIQQNTRDQIERLAPGDILIQPDLGDVSTASFHKVVEAASIGISSTLEVTEALKVMAVSEDEWQTRLANRKQIDSRPPVVDSVRVENNSCLAGETIRRRVRAQPGERLDVEALQQDIDHLQGIDIFDRVSFRVDGLDDGSKQLVIRADERRTGVNRLRFGLNLETDFENDSLFNLGVSATRLPVNGLGAEWRTEIAVGGQPKISTEFWQPLDYDGRYFVAPEISFRARNIDLFLDQSTALFEYRAWKLRSGIGAGRQLGQWGELRGGIRYDKNRARLVLGLPFFPSVEQSEGELFARFSLDTLDNPRFPTSGALVLLEGTLGLASIGASEDYQGVTGVARGAWTIAGNTLLAEAQAGVTFNDTRDIGTLYSLGGFLRLSGLRPDQLLGSDFMLYRVRGYRRIANLGMLSFQLPAYIGFSVETGGTWFDTKDIDTGSLLWSGSIYLALDTPLSPLYIAYGTTEGGNHAGYLFLGQVF
jgi:NTE family protein